MSIELIIYLISTVDSLNVLLGIIFAISVIFLVVLSIASFVDAIDDTFDEDQRIAIKRKLRFVFILSTISSLLFMLTPNSKTIAAMYLVPKVVNSKAAKELSNVPEKLVNILNKKLDDYVDSMLKEKETKK